MNALILVDLQNDFFPGGRLPVPNAHVIIPKINRLLHFSSQFPLVVATKDWHPADHASFADMHGKPVGELVDVRGIRQILWPVHCVQGTFGAEIVAGLDLSKVNKMFYKGTDREIDSYSAFFDNQHLKSTGLKEYLESHGIQNVYIAGLATDYCVKYSVLDACACGFNTFVISDACQGINLHPDDCENALEEMRKAGAVIVDMKNVESLVV